VKYGSKMDWFDVIYDLSRVGMVHEQQAKEVGVTRRTIGSWGAGRTVPNYYQAERLLNVYRSVVGSTG